MRVRAQDRHGEYFERELEGLLAVCVQHEMDHLDGRLFVDYLSSLKRERIRRKLDKERRDRGDAPVARPAGTRWPPTSKCSSRSKEPRDSHGTAADCVCRDAGICAAGARRAGGLRAPAGRRADAARPARRPRPRAAAEPRQGARARARPAGGAAAAADGRRRPRARCANGSPICWWWSPTGCCCRARCSNCRAWAASTSTPRCCRAGAARRRSSARSWPAIARSGVTIMQLDAGLDTGPVYAQQPVTIGADMSSGELASRLAAAGAGLLLEVIAARLAGTAQRPCAAGRGHQLCAQARQGRGADRLERARRADRAAGARLQSLAGGADPARRGAAARSGRPARKPAGASRRRRRAACLGSTTGACWWPVARGSWPSSGCSAPVGARSAPRTSATAIRLTGCASDEPARRPQCASRASGALAPPPGAQRRRGGGGLGAADGSNAEQALAQVSSERQRAAIHAVALGHAALVPASGTGGVAAAGPVRGADRRARCARLLVTAVHQLEYSPHPPATTVAAAVDAARLLGLERAGGTDQCDPASLPARARGAPGDGRSRSWPRAPRTRPGWWRNSRRPGRMSSKRFWPPTTSIRRCACASTPVASVAGSVPRGTAGYAGCTAQRVAWVATAVTLDRRRAAVRGARFCRRVRVGAGCERAAGGARCSTRSPANACSMPAPRPGGKTGALLERAGGALQLTALDSDAARAARAWPTISSAWGATPGWCRPIWARRPSWWDGRALRCDPARCALFRDRRHPAPPGH